MTELAKSVHLLRVRELKCGMDEATIRYTQGDLTVRWKPNRCTHSGICVRGLPKVFDVKRKPWIDMTAAEQAEIIAQVERCPSGALSWERNPTDT